MNEMNNTEYYIIFDVNPKDYVDVSIYALNYSHILLRKLIQCGFTKIYNILFATRNNIRSINGFGEKQIEIFESELAHYLNKNIEANDNDKDTICSISEQKYSQLYNVNPNTFCDIDLSVLKLQRGFICRLNECGFSNVGSLLKSARKDIIRFHGIGEKQIITLEKELKSYLVKTGAVSLAKEDSVSVKEALMYENMSYYQIFSVDPDDYTEVDISVLQITPGIRIRLAQNGYTTVRALLKSKRSELLLVKGVGVKRIDRIETDLNNAEKIIMSKNI
jgi:DNA-directed RNA polymerase alpha subunit